MDEVDGMSSGDRGGMQELVGYIKKSKIPIICICNDRSSQKIRTLAGYCLDLRFRKPTIQQITNRLYNIAQNEGFRCDIPSIQKLAEGTNGDIRQMLHLLQFWSNESNKDLSFKDVKDRISSNCKDLTMGPWDVTPKFFHPNINIMTGINYYFVDYSLIPLMIQENYLNISNRNYSKSWGLKELEFMTEAAVSIADADLIDNKVRSLQAWSLLPYHGVLSSLKPAQKIAKAGRIAGRFQFPSWLSKYSGRKKNDRLYSEIANHMNSPITIRQDRDHDVEHLPSVNITGHIIAQDYLPILKQLIIYPLNQNGNDSIDDVVAFMKMYNISREDWDNINSLGLKSQINLTKSKVATKVKTAFTKKCKIELTTQNINKKKMKKGSVNDLKVKNEDDVGADSEPEDDEDNNDDNDDDISKDNLIKQKKNGKKGKTNKKKKKTTKKKK